MKMPKESKKDNGRITAKEIRAALGRSAVMRTIRWLERENLKKKRKEEWEQIKRIRMKCKGYKEERKQ